MSRAGWPDPRNRRNRRAHLELLEDGLGRESARHLAEHLLDRVHVFENIFEPRVLEPSCHAYLSDNLSTAIRAYLCSS